MGEIGFPRNEFLYDLRLWEIRSIIKGYRLRARTVWESSRLNAFFIMSSMADLRKAGIYRDTDLVKFPWEKVAIDHDDQPSSEDVERLRELMRQENARLQAENDSKPPQ